MTPEQIARVTHEANRAYQVELGEEPNPHFDDAPGWMQASAIQGVRGIEDGNTPEQSHENWREYRRSLGWTHGPTKDEELRTHPCMVDYADLPVEQKIKDSLFATIAATLLYGEEAL